MCVIQPVYHIFRKSQVPNWTLRGRCFIGWILVILFPTLDSILDNCLQFRFNIGYFIVRIDMDMVYLLWDSQYFSDFIEEDKWISKLHVIILFISVEDDWFLVLVLRRMHFWAAPLRYLVPGSRLSRILDVAFWQCTSPASIVILWRLTGDARSMAILIVKLNDILLRSSMKTDRLAHDERIAGNIASWINVNLCVNELDVFWWWELP
jgi:hypothetical protein